LITNVTIISTNLNRNILKNYSDYKIIDSSFNYQELLKYKKVIFFNVLSNLSFEELKKLYVYLNSNNILFINVTNNMEEVLHTKNLIIYDKDKILAEGNTLELLSNEKLIKRLGFNLPFIVELSTYLKDYNLTNKIYLDKESLIGDLWK